MHPRGDLKHFRPPHDMQTRNAQPRRPHEILLESKPRQTELVTMDELFVTQDTWPAASRRSRSDEHGFLRRRVIFVFVCCFVVVAMSSTFYSLCPTFHKRFSSFFFRVSWFVAASASQKGANLNYDETVVYNEAAAIPSFMIVYRM